MLSEYEIAKHNARMTLIHTGYAHVKIECVEFVHNRYICSGRTDEAKIGLICPSWSINNKCTFAVYPFDYKK